MAKIFFITATGTGIGKTVFTGLLLAHLRETGVNALAIKPFASGTRGDTAFLQELQDGLLSLDEITPFFVKQPVAPAVVLRGKKRISIDTVLRHIEAVASRCDVLLIEGIGGVMVPLSERFTVLDLIKTLKCPVFVMSANQLGTVNHTLLTVKALEVSGVKEFRVVLNAIVKPDASVRGNKSLIQEFGEKTVIFELPCLGKNADSPRECKKSAKKMKKTLARILGDAIFITVRPDNG